MAANGIAPVAAAIALLGASCGPPDEAVRTAGDAARIARQSCGETTAVSEWRSERVGDYWIARLGEPDARGRWRLSARIGAAEGGVVCDVALR